MTPVVPPATLGMLASFEQENGLVVTPDGAVRYTGRLAEALRGVSPELAAGYRLADLESVYVAMAATGGAEKPEISEDTEVWLDFTVDDGAGTATASVPFVPQPGARSVVIHAIPTDHHTGLAGARLACLPVVW